MSEDSGFQHQACWAPDDNKRPRGTPFPVQHFHGSLSMMPIPDTREIGLNAARDRLFFSLVESTGNIWLARIGAR